MLAHIVVAAVAIKQVTEIKLTVIVIEKVVPVRRDDIKSNCLCSAATRLMST